MNIQWSTFAHLLFCLFISPSRSSIWHYQHSGFLINLLTTVTLTVPLPQMNFKNAWLFCPKVSQRNKANFSLLFKTKCYFNATHFCWWKISRFFVFSAKLWNSIPAEFIEDSQTWKLILQKSRFQNAPTIRNLSITFNFCSKKTYCSARNTFNPGQLMFSLLRC